MNKCDVAQRLANYVIMPKGSTSLLRSGGDLSGSVLSTSASWECQKTFQFIYKPTVREDFLNFVDCNVQPNGRSVDSSGPTHYFVSTFTTIQVPKKGVANFEERKARSVVEFNRIQEENGKQGCSNGSASN